MKGFLVALALLFVSVPAFAAEGLTPDYIQPAIGLDWISGSFGERQVSPINIQYAYSYGVSYNLQALTSHRVLASPGDEENPSAFVNEFTAGVAYHMAKDFYGYASAMMSLWGDGFTGTTEELYGGMAGIAFPSDGGMRMTVMYRHLVGRDGLRQTGLVFGPVFEIGG